MIELDKPRPRRLELSLMTAESITIAEGAEQAHRSLNHATPAIKEENTSQTPTEVA